MGDGNGILTDPVTGDYIPLVGVVELYAVWADGTRSHYATGSYLWTPWDQNAYGYAGQSPVTLTATYTIVAKDITPRFLGYSPITGHDCFYATQAAADSQTNPIEIDHTQTLAGDSYAICWRVTMT